MNKEQLLEFLKDNLTISSSRHWFGNYITITLKLNNETISETDVNIKDEQEDNDW